MSSRRPRRRREQREESLGESLRTFALALGLAPSTLRVQIMRGRLKATKLGRDWFVDEAEVERYRKESKR